MKVANKLNCVALAFVLLALIGCHHGGALSMTEDATPPTIGASQGETKLAGKWKGKLEIPEADTSKDPGAAMAKGMGEMMLAMLNPELEFPTEATFKMSMMGISVEGEVDRDGQKLTLNPKTIMGMKPEEFKKLNNTAGKKESAEDPSEPMHGTISADGKSITLEGKDKKNGNLVFVPSTDSGRQNHPDKTANEGERRMVGNWKGRVQLPPEKPNMTEKEKQDRQLALALNGSVELKLHPDKTFDLKLMFELGGKWSIEGSTLVCDVTRMGSLDSDSLKGGKVTSKSEPMKFTISSDGKTMTVVKTKPDEPDLIMTKE